jgi:hypothetical protein
MAKVGGLRLKLQIAEKTLGAKLDELGAVKDKLADVTTERDFLRKILSNLSEYRRYA